MPFRTSFYLGSTLTYDVLKVMFGGVKHENSKRYEYLSDLKAIEMQYGLLKTKFIAVWQSIITLCCRLTYFFVVIIKNFVYLFIFFSSNNLKQLSTFHPPFRGR